MNIEKKAKNGVREFGEPSNYYEGVEIKYSDGQPYCETITLLDSGEVVISTWIHTPEGILEDAVQLFCPTERDWKLIKAVHGEIKVGETLTTRKIWRGVTDCFLLKRHEFGESA
jgi:hypothetical protein